MEMSQYQKFIRQGLTLKDQSITTILSKFKTITHICKVGLNVKVK